MKKKVTIALIVAAFAFVIYWFFIRKSETEKLDEKWDQSQGTWTIAQREAALSYIKQWLDHILGQKWQSMTHADAVYHASKVMKNNPDRVFPFPTETDFNAFLRTIKDNGVWAQFIQYRTSEVTTPPVA